MCQHGIARGVGVQHVVHHFAGDFSHGGDQGERIEGGAALDLVDALGDVLGVIADALDNAGNLQRGEHFAQIVGHGGAQRNDLHHQHVDLLLQRVDALVAGDDAVGEALRTLDQSFHRFANRHFGQAAHLADQAAQLGDFLVESFGHMFRHHFTHSTSYR